MNILKEVWSLLNTPAGITMMAGILLWVLNRLYTKKPTWKQWEGTVISAVKWVEKILPTETPGQEKLKAAVDYFIKVYTATTGKAPSVTLVASVTDGASVVHDRLEKDGTLKGREKP